MKLLMINCSASDPDNYLISPCKFCLYSAILYRSFANDGGLLNIRNARV